MKTLPFLIFGITVLAQWAAPLSQIWTHEKVLTQGTLLKLKCTAPDPYDPLRGRYLAVRPSQREADVPTGMELKQGAEVYAVLTTGADGFATVSSLSLTPPASGDYLRVKAHYVYENKTTIDWPFDRFYVNEKLAPEADEWFAENIRSTQGITAEVRVFNGHAVLEDLSFDGKPFREILKARMK